MEISVIIAKHHSYFHLYHSVCCLFVTFIITILSEVLPLVEFAIVDGIDEIEAKQLIEAEPPLSQQQQGETTADDVFKKQQPALNVCYFTLISDLCRYYSK
jgi:hypothetical protein